MLLFIRKTFSGSYFALIYATPQASAERLSTPASTGSPARPVKLR